MQDSQLTAISSFITLQKLFPADPAPLVLIVQIGEGGLLLHRHPSSSFLGITFLSPQYAVLNPFVQKSPRRQTMQGNINKICFTHQP